jgi:predicted MFS family arabinose efflux permease
VAFYFAMQGQMLTRSILAWDLAGKATHLAYINLVVAVPMLVASMIGGAITDRIERRQIVIIGQSLLVCNELFILTLLIFGDLQFWHMMCTAFVSGCVYPFIMPAHMAITATVVGPQRLQNAMAFSSGLMNLSRVAGPAVMGLLIASYSVIAAYAVAAGLYLVSVMCIFGVKVNHSAAAYGAKKALLSDIMIGFDYLYHNRPLFMCILCALLPMFVAMPFFSLLVMLAEQTWQQGESGVGTLIAMGGVGGVLGSIWIVGRGDSQHRLKFMVGCTLGFALFLGLFSQTTHFLWALLPLLIANTFSSAAQTINGAIVQILVDEEFRGRVSSVMMMSFGLTPLGVFPMAIAADHFGAANAIAGSCVVLFALIALIFMLSPTLRNLDTVVINKLEKIS